MKSAPYKSVLTYRLAKPELVNAITLAAALPLLLASKPDASQMSKTGFVPPFPGDDQIIGLLTATSYAVTVETAERLIPTKVLKSKLAKVFKTFEDKNERVPTSREKSVMKDEVLATMMPRAFVGRTRTNAVISLPYIFIEGTSVKKAELLLACLRRVLGSFPVQPLAVENQSINTFSSWVSGKVTPEVMKLGEAFTAKGKHQESHTLSGKNVSLDDERLSDYLTEDYQVTAIELGWPDSALGATVPFILNEDLGIKGIKWPDALTEAVEQDLGEDDNSVSLIRASTTLMADRVYHLVQDIVRELGGERKMEPSGEEDGGEQRVRVALTDDDGAEYDHLLQDATDFVIEKQRATISGIQRQFRIGYNRSARIIEQLEEQGVIGPAGADGTRPVWKTEAFRLGDTNLNTDFNLQGAEPEDELI